MDESAMVYDEIVESLKNKVENFLATKNLQHEADAQALLNEFKAGDSFRSLNTLKKQLEALQVQGNFVEPRDVFLGYRVESVFCPKLQRYRPKKVLETYQYVSIIDTIKLVLSNIAARDKILLSDYVPNEDFFTCFEDGQVFQNSDFYREHPRSIRLLLYYDDVDVVNPLGSKTEIHKIGAFYATIMNFEENSQLGCIHTVQLCCDQDVRKYGFHAVLGEFMKEVKMLESGVEMTFDGETHTIYGTIAGVSADTLAAHEIFGLLGPAAKFFVACAKYPGTI